MVKKKSSAQCSAAGKALAECRWGSKKKKAGKKPKARKLKAPVRKSRRLAGQGPVRGPEPKKKPKKKKAQKAGPLKGRTAAYGFCCNSPEQPRSKSIEKKTID